MGKIYSGASEITLSANFSSTSQGCTNDALLTNTFVLNSSFVPPFSPVYVYLNGYCGGFWAVYVVDSRGVRVDSGNTCFNGASCGMVGKQPVTINYKPAIRCSDDSCRVDCAGVTDGFCCIDHAVTNRLLQVLQNT